MQPFFPGPEAVGWEVGIRSVGVYVCVCVCVYVYTRMSVWFAVLF